jgi:hypothetical protein
MSTQLLIEELSPAQSGIIQESSSDGKNVWLSGIFMQADIKNRNNRIYPLDEISRAVTEASLKIQEMNGIFGELDHPQTLSINLDRISHAITDLRMEGSNAYGRAKLLPTPMGNIAKTLVESGVRLGVSSRGAGEVGDSGTVKLFSFVTVDIVATPSAPEAMPTSIYESLEMMKSGRNVLTLAEQVQHDPAAQKYLKQEIMKFLGENLFAKR